MLRGCGGAGMPGAGATELSPQLRRQFNQIHEQGDKIVQILASIQGGILQVQYSRKKTSDGATINQEKERGKRVLESMSKALIIHCHH